MRTPEWPRSLFQEGHLNCYDSKMEKYCLENSRSFKILLTFGSALVYLSFIDGLHHYIKVVFLLTNTTFWTQSMDHRLKTAFNAYYVKRPSPWLLIQLKKTKTLMQFWKDYNICDFVENLTWVGFTKEGMNSIWKRQSRSLSMISEDPSRRRRLQKSTELWVRWQTTS